MEQMEQEIPEGGVHPRLLAGAPLLTEAELVGVMKELVAASEEISWAKLENRQPMLAGYFKTYEQRSQAAELVGQELFRRGGRALLDQVLERDLNQYASMVNWWSEMRE
jgi:hypothetical protein